MTIHQILKEKKLKVTRSRVAILRIFTQHKTPLDIQMIIKYLGQANIQADTVTVYRTIQSFMASHLVRQIEFQEGKFRYELTSLPHHHHAVCTNCGKIEDVTACGLLDAEQRIKQSLHFTVQSHTADFYGLCAACS